MSTRNSPRFRNHRHAPRAFTILELIVVLGILGLLVALLLPVTRNAREPARRTQCKNHLKQIALAMHNYNDEHGVFPPAYLVDAEGQRLHSWRTLLLPYLDQKSLYEQIDLTKPWNDPVNAKAYAANPYGYDCPSADMPVNHTTYMAVLADNSCLQPTTLRDHRRHGHHADDRRSPARSGRPLDGTAGSGRGGLPRLEQPDQIQPCGGIPRRIC
jgi:prepilin-type N-terminal cleavage/methylation domain-containing protein